MKKNILLIIMLFVITGCSNIYDKNYDEIVNSTLNQKKVKDNTFLKGYKLYLPEHMTMIGDLNDNVILYSYGDKYYLYTDLISYYNKKQNNYDIDNLSYLYSKNFIYNNQNGYVLINKSKGGYLVEIMYNYAKIEVVTNDVNKALSSGIIVLKNIRYNHKIIDSMIGSNALVYDSENFSLLGPNSGKKDNFLTYEKEYGTYDKDENKDEDVVDIDDTE